MALNIDCSVHNGEINFGKIKLFENKGLLQAK